MSKLFDPTIRNGDIVISHNSTGRTFFAMWTFEPDEHGKPMFKLNSDELSLVIDSNWICPDAWNLGTNCRGVYVLILARGHLVVTSTEFLKSSQDYEVCKPA